MLIYDILYVSNILKNSVTNCMCVIVCRSAVMAGGEVDLSRKFVSENELDEKRKKRQEEWEKVRKPEDPEGKNTHAHLNTIAS